MALSVLAIDTHSWEIWGRGKKKAKDIIMLNDWIHKRRQTYLEVAAYFSYEKTFFSFDQI